MGLIFKKIKKIKKCFKPTTKIIHQNIGDRGNAPWEDFSYEKVRKRCLKASNIAIIEIKASLANKRLLKYKKITI